MEVVPVSLSDPWSHLAFDPNTSQLLFFLPVIAFIALLFAAIWLRARRFPISMLGKISPIKEQQIEAIDTIRGVDIDA